MTIFFSVVLVALAALVVWGVVIYNGLVGLADRIRIAFAGLACNDAVMRCNIQREVFPNTLVARRFGFPTAGMRHSEEGAAIRQNVQVNV